MPSLYLYFSFSFFLFLFFSFFFFLFLSKEFDLVSLTSTSIICSIAGSLGSPVLNNPGLPLSTAPILGAAPVVSPLVAPLVQAPVPGLAGLPGAGLQVPAVTVPSIDTIGVPSECLMLKNMFDPKLEVGIVHLFEVSFFCWYCLLSLKCMSFCRRSQILIWTLKKMFKMNALSLEQ